MTPQPQPNTPSADDGSEDLAPLRHRLERELSALLTARAPGSHQTVMGAGSDDLEPGRRLLALLAPGGYAVPTWPVEHGGMGLGRREADVVADVLARFELPDLYPWHVGLELVGPTVLVHGTEEQKARWLPPLRDGTEIWCQGFSEPDAGSDLANLKTRAERRPDGWHLTGSKVWTSRAHYSQRSLFLARSDPYVPKHAGIVAFGLDMATPGITVRPLVQMNRDSHFNEVFLDDVVVPDTDRLGEPGEGWRVAITCLSFERGSLSGDLGVTLEELAQLADHERLAERPWLRERLTRAVADLRIVQLHQLRSRAARTRGVPGPGDSGSKLLSGRLIREVAGLALAAEGVAGVTGDTADDAWETMFLVSPSLSIRGGTDEIQRNIVGERVLGLPREPRVDRDRPFVDRPDR
ncbi:MAG: acyl-CoA dehydrogenase family protein [Acidimicrobiaceae bacterium]|nr:acyl-CoA dehydrogenase family protein [Acidimicrobiaceae bacterium]